MALLRLEEVAQRLGVSYNTVRGYINDGLLKAKKIGRAIRIEDTELQRFIEAQTQEVKRK